MTTRDIFSFLALILFAAGLVEVVRAMASGGM